MGSRRGGRKYSTWHRWKMMVWSAGGKKCFYCGNRLSYDNATIDHFVPINKGGDDKPENMVASCLACNLKKGNMMPRQFLAKLEEERDDTKPG